MSLVTRSISKDGTLAPSALNILDHIPEEALFHTAHRLRHPASIYELSLKKLAEAFCQVGNEYLLETERCLHDPDASLKMSQLLKFQVNFLRALQEHVDELWLILKTLVDPVSAVKHGDYSESYVVDNKLPGAKSFREAIADYKRALRIANKLKHQQCHLRGVGVRLENSIHLGYCLEEPHPDGAMGPSLDIHPDQGAFSFARDLTWHLANVYLCSEKLVKAITKALGARGISIQYRKASVSEEWKAVVSLVDKIPMAYFPKELRLPLARFSLNSNFDVLSLKIPSRIDLEFPSSLKVTYSFAVDRHSPRCRVPVP
ncbi:hypothetical protein FTW19_05335 [Terriglobus albidus]|uniref:Uncharacterized protein n=1 Tax=Terriglobus albidus TaxID=1592106 RepID=A0A5B9E5B9_9BACT|nr:hypothetical protein [Terriglobus albidus]QEE27483.1 hypothetical protein FTW19_05335 [Terriglobus albidus]